MKAWTIFFTSFALSLTSVFGVAAGSPWAIPALWNGADALWLVILFAISLMIASFVSSILTQDHSWVDRLWSIAPIFMVLIYAQKSAWRFDLLLLALSSAIWGVRLSWNFGRKGGYTGIEDYRWQILKGRIKNPVLWQVFNILFICMFQIGLFVLFTLPAWVASQIAVTGLSAPMWAALAGMVAAITIETVADHQQWNFQAAKSRYKTQGVISPEYAAELKDGFIQSGLFSHSRHPNYFGELSMWWMFYFFGSAACGTLVNISLLGPLVLTALFVGSTIFTEEISAGKYPAYKQYQKAVSPIIPWFQSKLQETEEDMSQG